MSSRVVWPAAILLLGVALVLGALFLRPSATTVSPSPAAPTVVPPSPPPPPAPTPAPTTFPGPPTSPDPVLRQWQTAIRVHDAKGVLQAQSSFLEREEEYREPLMKMSREDADPRIRAFCVAVLGRMKVPPPEAFFIERLDDASAYPRVSALQGLEKLGTTACLTKVDRLASSEVAEGARAAAERTAKAVRSR